MKKRELFALWLSLPLMIAAVGVQAQTVPYEVEIGYRTTNVDGNEQMYRSQINERSGFLLRSFTLATSDFGGATKLFDRLRVDASELGAGPAGSLRLEASKADKYRFTLGYRHADVYSALPAFANPLLSKGVTPGQHTWDRTRSMLDVELELTAGRVFTPFVGYSMNNLEGPGTTTYRQGLDEFLLSQNLKDRDHEFRVGTGFRFGKAVYGSITEGWRKANSRENLTLIGAGTGNNTTPILGRDSSATTITRSDGSDVKTPFTNFYATAQMSEWLRVTGNYARFSAETNGNENESVTGSLLVFSGINRFYSGLTETASQSARNKTWRGGGRAEVAMLPGLDGFVSYQRDHRELTGTALINALYSGTTNLVGLDPRSVTTVLNAESGMTRKDDVMSVGVAANPVGPLSLRAEYRHTRQNMDVSPDVSEIVVSGSQGGEYERNITTLDGNASLSKAGFMVGVGFRRDTADDAIVRTDFKHRDRTRLRASWTAPRWVKVGATAENLKQSNPQVGIQMDGKVKQYSGDIEVTPVKTLGLRASASKFKADNSALYRKPESFATDFSVYAEEGKAREGGVMLNVAPVSIDASVSKFENRGDNPFEVNRSRVRVGLDIPKTRAGLVVEYSKDKYHELSALFGDFDAKRWGIFLRLHP